MDDTAALEQASAANQRNPRPRGVPLRQAWRWIAPGALGVLLAVVFFFGLWSASRSTDGRAEAIGFAAAALALIALAWGLRAQPGRPSSSLLVEDAASLVVLAGLLTALGIGGLVLAARAEGVALPATGYAMFVAGVALIFLNLRHYFDCRDASRRARDELRPREPDG